jgi:hypothetical protein
MEKPHRQGHQLFSGLEWVTSTTESVVYWKNPVNYSGDKWCKLQWNLTYVCRRFNRPLLRNLNSRQKNILKS